MPQLPLEDEISLKELGPPAFRAFKAIADAWQLSSLERHKMLGLNAGNAALGAEGGQGPDMDAEMLLRISYILGIYGALHVLLPRASQAAAWLRASNAAPLFAGRPALERMTSGNMSDLRLVRQYLEAECG